jgi:hypothetical protein
LHAAIDRDRASSMRGKLEWGYSLGSVLPLYLFVLTHDLPGKACQLFRIML